MTLGKDASGSKNELIAWRRRVDAYPHVSFADVFAQAEGDKPREGVPTFAGKVVIIGATAPSLYDIHPTPLSPTQAGVDSLATVIDNVLNQRHIRELPRWVQAALAIALCVGLALWAQFKGLVSLAPALFALPAALLGISYLSLNGLPLFVDLHLAAGLALIFPGGAEVLEHLAPQSLVLTASPNRAAAGHLGMGGETRPGSMMRWTA
ncbi:MAG: CHASE2 domain-containing protein [Comamonadaceae bacterium]|nr:CHASE2 domain-containing protein [Comamonadaceae bacterium]